MKSSFPFLLLGAAAACSPAREDMSIQGLAQPSAACEMNAGALLPEVTLDTAEGKTLDVPVVFDNTGPEELTPDLIDVRWICATPSTPPLLLPDVDPTMSFCFDNIDPNFVGFDAYPVTADPIAPNTRGIALARIVPTAIGDAFDRMLAVAREADGCCREADCTRTNTDNLHCQKFAAMTGGPTGTLEPTRFRDFAIYDGTYADALSPEAPPPGAPPLGARYFMTAGFALRGLTQSGVEVFSAPFEQKVSFCRSCGELAEGARRPMPGMSCFHSRDQEG